MNDIYDGDREQGVASILNEEMDHIDHTMKMLDMRMFFQIVDLLTQSKRVFIVCARSTVGLGLFSYWPDFQEHGLPSGSRPAGPGEERTAVLII